MTASTSTPTPTPAVGDIVLVVIPFSSGAGDKKRPALVLSGINSYGDLLLLSLTSNPDVPGGVPIVAGDLASGSFDKPTWVRPDKVSSIQARRIDRVIGRASRALLDKVNAMLCPLLGCTPTSTSRGSTSC